jgi:hypothetical protein
MTSRLNMHAQPNLYNERPTWLSNRHAVLARVAWPACSRYTWSECHDIQPIQLRTGEASFARPVLCRLIDATIAPSVHRHVGSVW